MTRRRARRILALLLASVTACVAFPPAAVAQQSATGTLRLVSQTPFLTAGGSFTTTLRARTSSAEAGLEIAVGVYRRLRSRSEFANSLEGRLPTRNPNDLARFPLDTLPADTDGNVTVSLDPRASQDGVYPVRMDLRDAEGNVLDGFTTFLTVVPAVVEGDPLGVAVVLPLHAPPALRPDTSVELDPRAAAALSDVAGALASHPSVHLTLAPTPETLEALEESAAAADRDTAAALARVAANRQIPRSPYVPVDRAALLGAGLQGEHRAQLARGSQVVEEVLEVAPDGRIALVDERLDGPALDRLVADGVTGMVIAESALDPIRLPNSLTLTATFGVAGAPAVRAAAADPALAAHFERDAPPALIAAHLLADLAVLWLDLPGRNASRRGVVVMPSRRWVPDPTVVETLLEGMEANPIFSAVTVSELLDQTGPLRAGRTVTDRRFLPREESVAVPAREIRAARRLLRAFAAVAPDDSEALERLDRAVLVSQSNDLSAGRRVAFLRGVEDTIRGELDQIAMPAKRSITLTAREGELPITITSTLDYPTTVELTLSSDALDFPAGASRTVELTRQNTTERFTVHARGSGSFPVRVRVSAPGGMLVIEDSLLTVRSTAVSGVGVGLSVGAALFLVVWWASHLRSRRGSRASRRGAPDAGDTRP